MSFNTTNMLAAQMRMTTIVIGGTLPAVALKSIDYQYTLQRAGGGNAYNVATTKLESMKGI